jgi:hypothetical protein
MVDKYYTRENEFIMQANGLTPATSIRVSSYATLLSYEKIIEVNARHHRIGKNIAPAITTFLC